MTDDLSLWYQLDITDDFIFEKVMETNPELC